MLGEQAPVAFGDDIGAESDLVDEGEAQRAQHAHELAPPALDELRRKTRGDQGRDGRARG